METFAELQAREEELSRERDWLQDVVHRIARARFEQAETLAFKLLQDQALRVGQRRIDIATRKASVQRACEPPDQTPHSDHVRTHHPEIQPETARAEDRQSH